MIKKPSPPILAYRDANYQGSPIIVCPNCAEERQLDLSSGMTLADLETEYKEDIIDGLFCQAPKMDASMKRVLDQLEESADRELALDMNVCGAAIVESMESLEEYSEE